LVVYQDGKVIFRLKPSEEVGPSSPKSGETIPDPSQAPGEPSAPDPALGSLGKANLRLLLQRVEPEYPEPARQQHIQGLVVLEAEVGKDGAVQQLTVISGNSMLATAASDAVRQWRFKPLVQNGRAVQFQIRIKVDFVLP
jgi:protein TonB